MSAELEIGKLLEPGESLLWAGRQLWFSIDVRIGPMHFEYRTQLFNHAAYGITNQRILVRRGRLIRRTRSVALLELTNLTLVEHASGYGTVYFLNAHGKLIGLFALEAPASVYLTVLAARRKALKA